MKVAHLIMAYKNPVQLQMLVESLYHADSEVYIHLDKKIDIRNFQFIREISGVTFIKDRKLCNWGGFSFVMAITSSLSEILSFNKKYDYINLLSGQDYPIKPISRFHEFLEANYGRSFISFESAQNSNWWQHAVTRYEHYHFTDFNIRGRYRVQAILNRVLPKRKFPLPLKLYGSAVSSWWTMTSECAQYVVDYLDENPKLLNFMRFTWAADEFLYATIIMNSPISHSVSNDNLRHIEWLEGKSNPKVFSDTDFETLKSSESFFARKFDLYEDEKIIGLLREWLSSHRPDYSCDGPKSILQETYYPGFKASSPNLNTSFEP